MHTSTWKGQRPLYSALVLHYVDDTNICFSIWMEEWKEQYSNKYQSNVEEFYHLDIWWDNSVYVDLHNAYADEYGYTLEMNT